MSLFGFTPRLSVFARVLFGKKKKKGFARLFVGKKKKKRGGKLLKA